MELIGKEKIKELYKNKKLRNKGDLNELLKAISKEVIEAALECEITEHLGYEKHSKSLSEEKNTRNGYTSKKVKTSKGEVNIEVPRDRKSEFEPIIVEKRKSDITGIEDKIISMYSRGMTTRDIQDHIEEIYGYSVSSETVSNITNSVLEKAKEWQSRPLEKVYPIVFMDALVLKIRRDGHIQNTSVYAILGITLSGKKECLGLWIGTSESSKFWLSVLNELKNRGLKEICIFAVDNLKGMSEAIQAAFPNAEIQKCIVHQIRNSLNHVSWKKRKEIAKDLKSIYTAHSEESGRQKLEDFKEKWDNMYPHISLSWENNWDELSTFFKYPEEIRRLIYTTNPIESFNSFLRKNTKNRGSFPSEDSAFKLLFLSIERIQKKWSMKIRNWDLIFSQILIYFGEKIRPYIE